MIIATNVVCRAEPVAGAPPVRGYQLGDRLLAGQVSERAGLWYFSEWDRCWLAAGLSSPFDPANPEPALLAAADHILARMDRVPFDDYVAVENLLLRTMTAPHSGRSVMGSSGLLQFRRLQIITRAIATEEAQGRQVARKPLSEAWFLAHENLVRYFDPADQWYVPVEVYWKLFNQHKSAPWAEELAWAAAQTWMPSDECYTACALEKAQGTFAGYWLEYPRGVHVSEALARAAKLGAYGASVGCTQDAPEQTINLVAAIRDSLRMVLDAGRELLERQLSTIERACGALPAAR